MFFSLVKEINRLISKGMPIHLLLRKTGVLKTCWKRTFLRKKIQRNTPALKSKKVQCIFGKTLILVLLSSAVFCLQNPVSNFFCFSQSFLENEVNFMDIMKVSPNILAKIKVSKN